MAERKIRYWSSAGELTQPEYEWETWFGDAGDRAVINGREGLSFRKYFADELERQREEIRSGYEAKRSAKDERRLEKKRDKFVVKGMTEHVAEMGRQSYKLRGVIQPLPETLEKALIKSGKRLAKRRAQSLESKSESEYYEGDYDDDDDDDDESSESSDDEDWNTTDWKKTEIEAAVDMLIEEIRNSPILKRRRIATAMLNKLLTKHKIAVAQVDLVINSLAEKALFLNRGGIRRTAEAVRLGHLLAAVSKFIPQKLSMYGCARKSAQLLSRKVQLAAMLIQEKFRSFYFEKHKKHLVDCEIRARKRAVHVVAYTDLLRQWRLFYHKEIGVLSIKEKHSQLILLDALCSEKNKPLYRKDRRIIVEKGASFAVQELCLSSVAQVRFCALQVLAKLAEEAELRFSLIHSGVPVTLSVLMQSELIEDRSMALEVLDLLLCSICYIPQEIHYKVWNLIHHDDSRKKKQQLEDLETKVTNTGLSAKRCKISSFIRSRDPVLSTYDAINILIDRRRDGGLLRWLKILAHCDDELVKVGACMCLFKLASSSCNPFVACIDEKLTIPEKKEANPQQFAERRRARLKHLTHTMIHNVASVFVPGLSIVALQICFQLCACEKTRQCLVDENVPELIRMNLCRVTKQTQNQDDLVANDATKEQLKLRGILMLLAFAGNSKRPLCLGQKDDGVAEVDEKPKIKNSLSSSERPYLEVLDLEPFDPEIDIFRSLQSTVLSMVSVKPESLAQKSIERFCFEFRGLDCWLEYIFEDCEKHWNVSISDVVSSSSRRYGNELQIQIENGNENGKDHVKDCNDEQINSIEHCCVAAIVLGRFVRLVPRIASHLGNEIVINGLSKVIRFAYEVSPKIPPVVRGLIEAGAEGTCFTLGEIARSQQNHTSRWLVASLLVQNDTVRLLGSLVSRGSKNIGFLETAKKAATLLGVLVPWLGLEAETISDLISESNTNALDEPDEFKIDANLSPEEAAQKKLRYKAIDNAKKAAEQGVTSCGANDFKSKFGSLGADRLVGALVETTSNRLIRALGRVSLEHPLVSCLCYSLARFSSTNKMSLKLLNKGISESIQNLFRSEKQNRSLKGKASGVDLLSSDDDSGGDVDDDEISKANGEQSQLDKKKNSNRRKRNRGNHKIFGDLSHERYVEKLRETPPTLMTLCAGIARTLEGKYEMIQVGAVKYALDLLCLVESSDETVKIKGESALLLARVANIHHPVFGSVNDRMIQGKLICLPSLMELGASKELAVRIRLHCLVALAQLCQDQYRFLPKFLKLGGLKIFVNVLKELEGRKQMGSTTQDDSADVLLRQTLRIIHALSSYMVSKNHDALLNYGLEAVLQRLANRGSDRKVLGSPSPSTSDDNDPLGSQPTVPDLALSVLSDLRLSIAYGSDVARQIATAPDERPLTSGILDQNPLSNGLEFMQDPFGFGGMPQGLYSVTRKEILPSSALGRLENGELRPIAPSSRRRLRRKSGGNKVKLRSSSISSTRAKTAGMNGCCLNNDNNNNNDNNSNNSIHHKDTGLKGNRIRAQSVDAPLTIDSVERFDTKKRSSASKFHKFLHNESTVTFSDSILISNEFEEKRLSEDKSQHDLLHTRPKGRAKPHVSQKEHDEYLIRATRPPNKSKK